MLIKAGVDISRLKRKIRKTLCIVDKIHQKHGIELVITSHMTVITQLVAITMQMTPMT